MVIDKCAANQNTSVQATLRGSVLLNCCLYEWSGHSTIFDDIQGLGPYATDFSSGFRDDRILREPLRQVVRVEQKNCLFSSFLKTWMEKNKDINSTCGGSV